MTAAHTKGEKISLDAVKREVFGKKLGALRKEEKIPANVFGKDFASVAISVDKKMFMNTFRLAGETQVVYLQVDKTEIPVVISDMHLDPVSDQIMHVDFKKVNLLIKTEAQVPVVLVGEADAVAHKKGDLITVMDELTVEALPADMPSEIEIDVTGLAEVDDAIHVSDIKLTGKVEIKHEADEIVVKIAEHKEEDLEPATAEETPAEGEAGGEAAPAEGGDDKKEEN
jgi:large subunit ribosomal protein L25